MAHFAPNPGRIAHQSIDGEVIAIDFESGAYFSMRNTAAEIWSMLCAGRSLEDIVATYQTENPYCADRVADEVRAFVEQLVEGRLLDRITDPVSSGEALGPHASFSTPVLEQFEDMADLIRLDPIHEVDDRGWPHRPAS